MSVASSNFKRGPDRGEALKELAESPRDEHSLNYAFRNAPMHQHDTELTDTALAYINQLARQLAKGGGSDKAHPERLQDFQTFDGVNLQTSAIIYYKGARAIKFVENVKAEEGAAKSK